MNGEFNPTYSTNQIWRDDDMNQCLTLDLEDIESDISDLQTGKADTTHTHTEINAKYEKPSTGIPKTDLASDVQSSLGKADSALQSYTETDPTIPAWAKATTKPTYTASEVGALPTTTVLADLTDDATHRTVTDAEKTAWNAKSTFSGSYNDLTDKPTIPSAITIDSELSSTSTNPVQNKVIKAALDDKASTSHVHNVFSSLTQIGITTFPTTMRSVVVAMPQNSMIVIDTRRVNGTDTEYSTETISDWGSTINGVAIISKGVTVARIGMIIMYGKVNTETANIIYGSYSYDNDANYWFNLNNQLDDRVEKIQVYSAIDLNTLTESGIYYVKYETTELNCPVGSNGHILVMSDGTHIRQVFFRVGTLDSNNFQWYSRTRDTDDTTGDINWSQWWLLSGSETAWSGTATVDTEINLGSRYGCQSWIFVGQPTASGTYSAIHVPRQLLTTNTTKNKFKIVDESNYISFYFYYKESDNNVYAKVVAVSNTTNGALKYVYRVS